MSSGFYLQLVTGHQEYASCDGLPPGLCPRGVVCSGVLLQFKRRRHSFGMTNCGADTKSHPLCAVRGRCALNPEVVVKLRGRQRYNTFRFRVKE